MGPALCPHSQGIPKEVASDGQSSNPGHTIMWPWIPYFTLWGLSFHSCAIEITIPTLRSCFLHRDVTCLLPYPAHNDPFINISFLHCHHLGFHHPRVSYMWPVTESHTLQISRDVKGLLNHTLALLEFPPIHPRNTVLLGQGHL